MYAPGCWYALNVRRGREFDIATSLRCKDYEVFLPQYRCVKRVARHMKECVAALFPGYLFCSIQPHVYGAVLTTPGVASFVSCGRVPIEVDPDEIRALQLAVAQGQAEPWPYVQTGQRVRIEYGALQGLEGLVIRVKNQFRLVVSITMLQRSAAIELDSTAVTPLFDTHAGLVEAAMAGLEVTPQR